MAKAFEEAVPDAPEEVATPNENFLTIVCDGNNSVNWTMTRRGVDPFQLAAIAATLKVMSDYEILEWHKANLPKVMRASESDLRVLESKGVVRR